jgi:phytoene/squalene synthetase
VTVDSSSDLITPCKKWATATSKMEKKIQEACKAFWIGLAALSQRQRPAFGIFYATLL